MNAIVRGSEKGGRVNDLSGHLKAFDALRRGTAQFLSAEARITDLRPKTPWPAWTRKKGVYVFVRQGKVVYVGRAIGAKGLGDRISCQLQSTEDPSWAEVVDDDSVVIHAYYLANDEEWPLISALEAYLIRQFKPEFNKRAQ